MFNFSSGQSELDSKPYYEFYDASLNYFNSGVFNGSEYVDEFRSLKTDNHKFYGSFDFSLGYVFYNGQPYNNLKMKYDLMRDVVVVEFVNEKVNNLFLNSILLSEFKLNNGKFVRL